MDMHHLFNILNEVCLFNIGNTSGCLLEAALHIKRESSLKALISSNWIIYFWLISWRHAFSLITRHVLPCQLFCETTVLIVRFGKILGFLDLCALCFLIKILLLFRDPLFIITLHQIIDVHIPLLVNINLTLFRNIQHGAFIQNSITAKFNLLILLLFIDQLAFVMAAVKKWQVEALIV